MEFCAQLHLITMLCIVVYQLGGLQAHLKIYVHQNDNGQSSYRRHSAKIKSESIQSESESESEPESESTSTSSKSQHSSPVPSLSKMSEEHSHSSQPEKPTKNKTYTTDDLKDLMRTAKANAEMCYVACISNPGFTSGIFDQETDSCQCMMMGNNAVIQVLMPYSSVKFNKREKCTVLCKYQRKVYFRGDYNGGSRKCNCYTTEMGDDHPTTIDFTNDII